MTKVKSKVERIAEIENELRREQLRLAEIGNVRINKEQANDAKQGNDAKKDNDTKLEPVDEDISQRIAKKKSRRVRSRYGIGTTRKTVGIVESEDPTVEPKNLIVEPKDPTVNV